MESVLCHHGVLGMKWGIRRYQNKDGSLTPAGQKRAAKMKKQYTELTGKQLRRSPTKKSTATVESTGKNKSKNSPKIAKTKGKNSSAEPVKKEKSISEMSDAEIVARINRITLENKLRELTPEQKTAGEKFAEALRDASVDFAKNQGAKLAGDMIDKQLRKSLGLSGDTVKKAKTASQILKEEAIDAENRYKKTKYKYEESELRNRMKKKQEESSGGNSDNRSQSTSSSTDSNSHKKKDAKSSSSRSSDSISGKVNGKGTSTSSYKDGNKDTIIDVDWRDVSVNDPAVNTNRLIGESYVAALLEEGKHK